MVITFYTRQGGIGKTINCLNTGMAFCKKGKRVLFIDLDIGLTRSKCLVGSFDENKTVIDAFAKGIRLKELAYTNTERGYDSVAGSSYMSVFETFYDFPKSRCCLFQELIEDAKNDYDNILIDGRPLLGLANVSAIISSDMVIVPTDIMFFDYTVEIVSRTINAIRDHGFAKFHARPYYLLNMVEMEDSLEQSELREKTESMGICLLNTTIKNDKTLGRAIADHKDIFRFDPDGEMASVYLKLADEISLKYCGIMEVEHSH